MMKKTIALLLLGMFTLASLVGTPGTASAACSGCGCITCCNNEYNRNYNPPSMDDITAALENGGEVSIPESDDCYQSCFLNALVMVIVCSELPDRGRAKEMPNKVLYTDDSVLCPVHVKLSGSVLRRLLTVYNPLSCSHKVVNCN